MTLNCSLSRCLTVASMALASVLVIAGPAKAACETGGFCVYRPTGAVLASNAAPSNLLIETSDAGYSDEQLDLALLGGSSSLIAQTGNFNLAITHISSSPGTIVGQIQRGTANASRVSVFGGSLNRVSASQSGTGLTSDIYLINSEQTTIRSHQDASSSSLRQLIVLYGKPGTVINLN